MSAKNWHNWYGTARNETKEPRVEPTIGWSAAQDESKYDRNKSYGQRAGPNIRTGRAEKFRPVHSFSRNFVNYNNCIIISLKKTMFRPCNLFRDSVSIFHFHALYSNTLLLLHAIHPVQLFPPYFSLYRLIRLQTQLLLFLFVLHYTTPVSIHVAYTR